MYLSIVAVIDSHMEEGESKQNVYAEIVELNAGVENPGEMLVEIGTRVSRFLGAGSMKPPNRVVSVSHSVFSSPKPNEVS